MNIISNNCAAGFLYKKYKAEYNNPFMCAFIDPKDYMYLIKNYNKINYKNYSIISLPKDLCKNNNSITKKIDVGCSILGIKIDNSISAYYTHYLENEMKDKIHEDAANVFVNDVEKYVIEKYITRVERMNEKPIFLVIGYAHHNWNKELLEELCNLENEKIILITNETLTPKPNVKIIYDDMKELNASIMIDKHFDEIKSEIEKFYEKPL